MPKKSSKEAETPQLSTQEEVSSVESGPEAVEDAVIVEEINDDAGEQASDQSSDKDTDVVASSNPSRSVLPMVLAGAAIAAVGFGAGYVQSTRAGDENAKLISQQSQQIAELESQIAGLMEEQGDIDLEGSLAGVEASAASRISALKAELDTEFARLESRIEEVERAPLADGSLTETALAAYEADIAALRDQIAEQQAHMAQLAQEAADQLERTRTEAANIEENAAQAARDTIARAAIAQIRAAVGAGEPFDLAVSDLSTAMQVPPELRLAAVEGVPNLQQLVDTFPEAARAALARARAEGLSGESSGIASFLLEQFDVRSVEPKSGDDVDAILSRAEASLRDGRLQDALAEIDSLPEIARAEMTSWIGQAQSRADVLRALDSLTTLQN